jgi:hypothetical protein
VKLRYFQKSCQVLKETKTEETLIEKLHIGDRGLNEISIHLHRSRAVG